MKGKLLVTIQFILLGFLAFVPSVNRGPGAAAAAIILISISIALLLKSFRDLGDALTPFPESKSGASLKTSGIYRTVRHPIYLALFILSSGVVAWKQSWQSIAVSILLIGLLLYKARYEDSLLLIKFPEAAKYQETTPAFFPKIKRG